MQLTTPSDEKGISAELRRALVDRILASNSFSRSDRLSKFLKYAFQKTTEGRWEDLSEYQIGLHVFERPDRYSPGEDSIVRSHARLLRQRLDAYFENEGKEEKIRITIPKGGYSLHFEHHTAPTAAVSQTPVSEEPATSTLVPATPTLGRRWWWAAVFAVLLGSALTVWISRPASLTDSVWKRIFARNTRTIIVPADSTLALFEDLTNQVVSLSDYLSHHYQDPSGNTGISNRLWTPGRRYTSMADLEISARLMRLPQAQSRDVVIRYARDLQMADLKGSNCVLLGGVRSNPWQEIFHEKLNFRIGYDPQHGENSVINVAPRAKESSTYNESRDSSYHRAYGVLALLPGLASDTGVVIIQGTSTAGTQAVADFLFDSSRFEEFLRLSASDGKRTQFFEVLLQAESVGGNAQRATVIASRVISPSSP